MSDAERPPDPSRPGQEPTDWTAFPPPQNDVPPPGAYPQHPPGGPGSYGQGGNGGYGAPGPYGSPPGGPGPYGQPPYGANPYGQPSYGVNPYGQAPYGANPYGPAPYGPAPYGYGYAPQTEKGATTSLVLGIVGFFICGILLGPAAILEGVKARKRIRESNGMLTGDGLAIGGIVLGSIVSLLYVVVVVALIIGSMTPSSRIR